MSTSVSFNRSHALPAAPSFVDCEPVASAKPDAYTTQELAAYTSEVRESEAREHAECREHGGSRERASTEERGVASCDPRVRARELKSRLRLAADALAVADLLIGMNDSVRSVGAGRS